MGSPSGKLRHGLKRSQRLRGRSRFDEVFKTGKRKTAFPLTLHALRREDNAPSRLGISIGRRCGTAVRRNLIKRRIREAFRLMQHEIPEGFDLMFVVKPHEPLAMSGEKGYESRLRQLIHSAT